MNDTRDAAYKLVEDGLVDVHTMLTACLKYMSTDDVQGMLEANEFVEEEEEEEEDEDEDEEDDEPDMTGEFDDGMPDPSDPYDIEYDR